VGRHPALRRSLPEGTIRVASVVAQWRTLGPDDIEDPALAGPPPSSSPADPELEVVPAAFAGAGALLALLGLLGFRAVRRRTRFVA